MIRTSEDLEAQINDIRIRKTMPGGVFDQDEVFNKFSGNEGYNYNSSQGHDDDGSDSESEDDESSAGLNREHQKFRGKYHRLRKYIKELMFENAALCDEVASVQEQVQVYHKQRKSLLARLLKRDSSLEKHFFEWQKAKQGEKSATGSMINGDDTLDGKLGAVPQKRKYKKRSNSDTSSSNATGKGKTTTTTKKQKQSMLHSGSMAASTSSTATLESTKPIEIPLNPNGQPIYPFSVNGFTVYSLGEIIWNKNGYHTDEYIYPVGYKITRIYGHFKDPEKKCVYTCRVIENGEFPKFEILANDSDPRDPKVFRITGPSPDYCHTTLLQYINNVCVRSVDIRPQGESFFGLANPTIMSLIRKLPNIEKCPVLQRPGSTKLSSSSSSSHKLALNSDATLNYDALQRHINLSVYHTVPEIKEEPPEDLFDN